MAQWRECGRGVVFPWLCDQFGHMNVRHYASHFDDAGFHLWPSIGVTEADFESAGCITVVASTHIDFVSEIVAGKLFVIYGGFVRAGTKSLTARLKMVNAESEALHATFESVEVCFDPKTRKAVPMPDGIRAKLEANIVDADGP